MPTPHVSKCATIALATCLTLLTAVCSIRAAENDRLILSEAGSKRSLVGTVKSISGHHGVIFETKGQTLRFPMSQVLAVQTRKTPTHENADRLFQLALDTHDPAPLREALSLYEQARRDDHLPLWLRQWFTVRIVECLRKLDRGPQAAQQFFLLCHIDPYTPFLNHVPLVWSVHSTVAEQHGRAAIADSTRQWLSPTENPTRKMNPVGQLLAASLLLDFPGPEREAALRALESLVTCTPPDHQAPNLKEVCRVTALLAMAQLWRQKLLKSTPGEKELLVLHDILEKLPVPLQEGPLRLLAEGYAKLGQKEKAKEYSLRLDILHPSQGAF